MIFGSLRSGLRDPAAPIGFVAVGVWLLWGYAGGGFAADSFGWIGALLVIATAVALAVSPPRRPANTTAVAMAAGLAVLSALSIGWAAFPGEAWLGSSKTALYVVSLVIFAVYPWSREGRVLMLAFFALGLGVIAGISLLQLVLAADPSPLLTDGRLNGQVEYVNGSVALWMLGCWPAVWLATVREAPVWLRTIALSTAVLLAEMAVLGQSRGWLYLLPLSTALFLLLSKQRLRAVLALTVTGVIVGTSYPILVQIADRAERGLPLSSSVDQAAGAIVLSAAFAAVVGCAWALLDRRMVLSVGSHRLAAIVSAALAAIAVSGVGVAIAAHVDAPYEFAELKWKEFTSGSYPEGRSRFGGDLGTNRFREWQVAWDQFAEHPLRGIGADNYAAAYLRERPNDDYNPRYPHSTPLRLLSQLGLPGAMLFGAAVTLLVVGALRRRRIADDVEGGAIAAALAIFSYWLLHGSIDWFWEIPALAAPAFGFLGLAAAPLLRSGTIPSSPLTATRARTLMMAFAAGLAGLLASAPLIAPALATTYTSAAVNLWRQRPVEAYRWLHRATIIDPLSAEPLLLEGRVAVGRGEFARATRAFNDAVAREPQNWYPHFQLGLLDAAAGRFTNARVRLTVAQSLNPQETVIGQAKAAVAQGTRLRPGRFSRLLLDDGQR